MSEKTRVGVFVCSLGCLSPPRIPVSASVEQTTTEHIPGSLQSSARVDADALVKSASTMPGVAYSMQHEFLCTRGGQNAILERIKNHGLNRIVVAACSPKVHEPTFRGVLEAAGLNPFLLEMVNAREQCVLVHPNMKEAAKKLNQLIRGAVEKARTLEEVERIAETVVPRALVIGGGTAGIQTALGLAYRNFEVYLIEKQPTFGGHTAQLGTVFPTEDCGLCISPLPLELHRKCMCRAKLLKHPRMKALTLASLKSLSGYPGNFSARIARRPRFVDEDLCITCGLCEDVCPVEIPDEFNLGLSKKKAIYLPYPHAVPHAYVIDEKSCIKCGKCVEVCPSKAINLREKSLEFSVDVGVVVVATGFEEFKPLGLFGFGKYPNVVTQLKIARMLDSSGPTRGIVAKPSDGKVPKRVVMIQCVGSRNPPERPSCSKICCMISLNQARTMKRKSPEMEITVCYKDLRLVGKNYETYYSDCSNLGVRFIRGDVTDVREGVSGALEVTVDKTAKLDADLVVLACAPVPREETVDLARMLGLNLSSDGFFSEAPPKLSTVDSTRDGVYICGCCQGPKDIPETATQAMAAATRAASFLFVGKLETWVPRAVVNKDSCIGCGCCEAACPYSAVKVELPGLAHVAKIACKGCGICAAECPMGAIQLQNYRDEQLYAQISGLMGKEVV